MSWTPDEMVTEAVLDGRRSYQDLSVEDSRWVVAELTHQGHPVSQIAAWLGCSTRQVKRVRAELVTQVMQALMEEQQQASHQAQIMSSRHSRARQEVTRLKQEVVALQSKQNKALTTPATVVTSRQERDNNHPQGQHPFNMSRFAYILANVPKHTHQKGAAVELRHFPTDDTHVTLADAADFIGVSVETIRRYIDSGDLPAFKVAGRNTIRVKANDVRALLTPVTRKEAP